MLIEAIRSLDEENPDQAEIQVQGYGRMSVDTAKNSVMRRLEEAVATIRKSDDDRAWRNIHSVLYSSGVVEAMLTAIVQSSEESGDMRSTEGS